MSKVRTGIVGCGKISPAHAAALATLTDSDFYAVCDADLSRAQATASEYGVPNAFGSLTEMLASGVEAVSVCTPHPTHEEIVVACAAAGVNVLCEKPIAVRLDEADRMIEAADKAGINFGVIFQRRFWPAAQRMHQAIAAGEIGATTVGICHSWLWRPREYFESDVWRGKWETEGGGVLMNQAVHVIDLLQWYMGPVVEAYGRYDRLAHGDYIDVEDTAIATLVFENGGLGLIQAATTLNPPFGFKVQVSGTKGHTLSVTEDPESTQGYNDIWTLDAAGNQRTVWEAAEKGQPGFPAFHKLQIEEFLRSVIEKRPPAVTGAEGRKALEIILAVYETSRTGQPKRF